jgi:hypothetical protein
LKAQVVLGDAAFVERFKPLLKEKEQGEFHFKEPLGSNLYGLLPKCLR